MEKKKYFIKYFIPMLILFIIIDIILYLLKLYDINDIIFYFIGNIALSIILSIYTSKRLKIITIKSSDMKKIDKMLKKYYYLVNTSEEKYTKYQSKKIRYKYYFGEILIENIEEQYKITGSKFLLNQL